MTADDFLLDEPDFERTVIGQNVSELLDQVSGLNLEAPTQNLSLELSPVLIGRDASCTLQLHSRMVSRNHAIIYKTGKHHVIRDLQSTNGVVHNGVRVNRAVIRAGDTLLLGDQKLLLTKGMPIRQAYANSCVVLFLDLESSTSLAEKYGDPFSKAMEEQMLNLEDQILIHLGTPIKALGDGLMCAFGLWPVDKPGYHAVDQALRFAWQAVKDFRRIDGYPPLRLRVGLHWGPVVVADRDDIDLFGDTVNLASRLEECNKHYGTQIMVSEEIVQRTRLAACLREVDTVRVAGKDDPVTVYCWDETFVDTRANGHRRSYEQALSYYRKGKFARAMAFLESGIAEGDALCKPLSERLQQLGDAPGDWTGIWSLTKTGY